MSKQIKAIFFDFDGVITTEKMGSPTIISYIAKEFGIPYEIVNKAYRKYNDELLYGTVTHEDMWDEFCEDVGQQIDIGILQKAFLNIKLDSKIMDYIREKHKDYLIGMITDNKVDRIRTIVEHTELKDLMDVVVISADVHSRKTESKIFEETLKRSGMKAEECVFIDNTAENLVEPAKMGFTTIFFDDEIRDYSLLY